MQEWFSRCARYVQKPTRFDSFSFMTAGGRDLGMDVDVDVERM
jgi:hypothetical protein